MRVVSDQYPRRIPSPMGLQIIVPPDYSIAVWSDMPYLGAATSRLAIGADWSKAFQICTDDTRFLAFPTVLRASLECCNRSM